MTTPASSPHTHRQSDVILVTATRYLEPLLLLFSVFLLLQGHHQPGGGFVGGLVAAAAFALTAIATNTIEARRQLRADTRMIIALGLSVALGSVLWPLLIGQSLMQGVWLAQPLPVLGKVGTPIIFDVGVYLTVIGVVNSIIFTLIEAQANAPVALPTDSQVMPVVTVRAAQDAPPHPQDDAAKGHHA